MVICHLFFRMSFWNFNVMSCSSICVGRAQIKMIPLRLPFQQIRKVTESHLRHHFNQLVVVGQLFGGSQRALNIHFCPKMMKENHEGRLLCANINHKRSVSFIPINNCTKWTTFCLSSVADSSSRKGPCSEPSDGAATTDSLFGASLCACNTLRTTRSRVASVSHSCAWKSADNRVSKLVKLT